MMNNKNIEYEVPVDHIYHFTKRAVGGVTLYVLLIWSLSSALRMKI